MGGLHSQQSHHETENPDPDTEPPNTGPLTGPGDHRSERDPAWLESVLRHSRSAEPAAGPGQVDKAENEKLRVEAMGPKRVS